MKKYAIFGCVVDVIKEKIFENGVVLVDGNKITYAGEKTIAEIPDDAEKIEISQGTILPGFIDCHAHFVGESHERAPLIGTPKERLLINAIHDIGELIDSGFTAARDMSAFGIHLKQGVERGYVRGPRIVTGGQVLSVTSGHADLNINLPIEFVQKDNVLAYLVDGVEGCLKGVRKQFREGAEFIKICATGGVSSQSDGLEDVQFSDEELKVIVEEAKRHGTYVAAHCTGTSGTKQALKAGIKTVEHGVMLDEECVKLMVKNQVSLVTTLYISLNVADMEGIPEFIRVKAKSCAEANRKSIDMVHKAGLNIAFGTDFSNTSTTLFSEIGREFEAIVSCGFTNMEAIQIGTINGAKVLRMEDKIGSLDIGKLADLVIVKGNPLEDISLLGHCDNIPFVMKDGVIEKNKI